MNINWYPGHMVKTRRLIKENLKLVDFAIELLDARIPYSSKNPDMDSLLNSKPKIVVLNKFDMADPQITKEWIEYYKKMNITCIPVNALEGKGIKEVLSYAEKLLLEKRQRDEKKGIVNSALRFMILGIPNVGKSTFINSLVGRKSTQTGNKPGVTRGKQWIRFKKNFEILDTPGILWPKFDDEEIGYNLAITGAIKDDVLVIEEVAAKAIRILAENYPGLIETRYSIETKDLMVHEIMEEIGKKRGCIVSGGEIDYEKTSRIILDDLRKLRIGNVSLEKPQ